MVSKEQAKKNRAAFNEVVDLAKARREQEEQPQPQRLQKVDGHWQLTPSSSKTKRR